MTDGNAKGEGRVDMQSPDSALVPDEMEKLKDYYSRDEALPVEGTDIFQRGQYASGDVEKAFRSAAPVGRNPCNYGMETK